MNSTEGQAQAQVALGFAAFLRSSAEHSVLSAPPSWQGKSGQDQARGRRPEAAAL